MTNTMFRTCRPSLRRLVSGLALMVVAAAATAQTYPSKLIKIVVPNPPGGASDITARLVAEKLGQKWSVPVVVDNKPGASNLMGTDFVAKAPADGYTLVLVASIHAFNVNLM